MIAGAPKETMSGERRVSLVPEVASRLPGVSFMIEKGAGEAAGFPDSSYAEKQFSVVEDSSKLFSEADIISKVQPPTPAEAGLFKEDSILVSFLYPLANRETVKILASRHVTAFAMELIPRISRSQSMDALS